MSNKRKLVRITTPEGIAKFPYLNTPDTKWNPDGEYRVGLLLDPENNDDHQTFLDRLDEMADEAVEKAKQDLIEDGKKARAKKVTRNDPYRPDTDAEGEETGLIEVRFKMKALIKKKDGTELRLSPALFDAQGKAIDPKEVLIYGGSTIKVNFTPRAYHIAAGNAAGVSLNLNAVQVIDLVTAGGGDASYFGFGEEEGFSVGEVADSDDYDDYDDGEDDDFDTNDEDDDFEGDDF